MNRGLVVWLGVALVLGALSAAIVRSIVRRPARTTPVSVDPTLEAHVPTARALLVTREGEPPAEAPRASLVALAAAEEDRRALRLSRRLRAFASDAARDDVRDDVRDDQFAPALPPPPAAMTDAGVAPADAGVAPEDAGAASGDAGVVPAPAAEQAPAVATRVRITLADENDAWLKLVSVSVDVDGHVLVKRASADGIGLDGDALVYEGQLFSGSHFVDATFVYRGAGGVFGYLEDYTLRVKGMQAIVVKDGAVTTLRVSGVDRGATWPLEERPRIEITTE